MVTDITIRNLQKTVPLKPILLKRIVKKVLKSHKVSRADLSFVFVNDSQIKLLNQKYLNRRYATDVLAFDFKRRIPRSLKKPTRTKEIIGEIIISSQTAKRNAKVYGTKPSDELALYVIHGILHLLGFSDRAPRDIEKMRTEESRLLKSIKNT
jgi:probable rRNA maturation factor